MVDITDKVIALEHELRRRADRILHLEGEIFDYDLSLAELERKAAAFDKIDRWLSAVAARFPGGCRYLQYQWICTSSDESTFGFCGSKAPTLLEAVEKAEVEGK